MPEEPLMSKLLRWITASVILGRLSQRSCMDNLIPTGSSLKTLQELLEYIKGIHGRGSNKSYTGCEEFIVDSILYLQQHLGITCRVLPSVTSALCVLLPNIVESTGTCPGPCINEFFVLHDEINEMNYQPITVNLNWITRLPSWLFRIITCVKDTLSHRS